MIRNRRVQSVEGRRLGFLEVEAAVPRLRHSFFPKLSIHIWPRSGAEWRRKIHCLGEGYGLHFLLPRMALGMDGCCLSHCVYSTGVDGLDGGNGKWSAGISAMVMR